MRFDLRLHGVTGEGKKCQADISVYANSGEQLQREAEEAATTAAWRSAEPGEEWIAEGSTITVEHVEQQGPAKKKERRK
jgi:hypothetical protein